MVDQAEFRTAMSKLGAAVSVVTSDGPAGRCGTTVTAVSSVTDTPATLLVCINRNSWSNRVLRGNRVLCVNVLPSGQEELARRFAGMTSIAPEHRFDGVDIQIMETGAPALSAALVSIDCDIVEGVEVGTHTVFLAQARQIRMGTSEHGLVYFDRRYVSVGMAQAT
jgi:flavin reductase (DIM6/NTAB) family NADH-FMN oxidoreductase RutF